MANDTPTELVADLAERHPASDKDDHAFTFRVLERR